MFMTTRHYAFRFPPGNIISSYNNTPTGKIIVIYYPSDRFYAGAHAQDCFFSFFFSHIHKYSFIPHNNEPVLLLFGDAPLSLTRRARPGRLISAPRSSAPETRVCTPRATSPRLFLARTPRAYLSCGTVQCRKTRENSFRRVAIVAVNHVNRDRHAPHNTRWIRSRTVMKSNARRVFVSQSSSRGDSTRVLIVVYSSDYLTCGRDPVRCRP